MPEVTKVTLDVYSILFEQLHSVCIHSKNPLDKPTAERVDLEVKRTRKSNIATVIPRSQNIREHSSMVPGYRKIAGGLLKLIESPPHKND